ncbi:hypothetical protein [Pseudoalteromonas viridis]|uniref:Lipoprotein n=1 Tax=Pseudoalteromonas viridis TaxID=339617 RepID=A0ABX7V286_9GAMM|nr:hypothetical protein [Pseudoalteromonas viridis]QTL34929.1 hypothetical protein J5X90_15555 [Pseudoalteromonas viridis]
MKLSKLLILPIFVLFFTSCKSTDLNSQSLNVGYACFEEPSDAMTGSEKYYLCVFELNRSSPFYDDALRSKKVNTFMSTLKGNCKTIRTWEMIDAKGHVEHSMFFINYRVQCT